MTAQSQCHHDHAGDHELPAAPHNTLRLFHDLTEPVDPASMRRDGALGLLFQLRRALFEDRATSLARRVTIGGLLGMQFRDDRAQPFRCFRE